MVDTYIVDKDGNSANAASTTVPADRNFRGAWVLNGTVISEDIDSAKEIFKDKIREVRKPLLEAKDALRDAPAASAIASATTIAELKAAWDTSVLGDSPY